MQRFKSHREGSGRPITLLASASFDKRKWVSSVSRFVSRLAATFVETEDEKIIKSKD